jgi:glutathione synthase/RimK-type ligase-like ATP-grasp enzyme
MRTCAFLTLEDPGDYVIDDDLAVPALAQLGWRVASVPWTRARVPWDGFDAVVIRSTWDYPDDPDGFLDVLRDIEAAGTPLFNPLGLARWNIRKTYLRDLEDRGVPVVPTVWRERLDPGALPALRDALGHAGAVVKPVVGASASGTFHVRPGDAPERIEAVEAYFADRALLAQPFLEVVPREGEFSLIYFGGAHSHTILKTPRETDFRVQEEHGGVIRAVDAEPALLGAGDRAIRALGPAPLYARADFVRAPGPDRFWLMELELIEPSLYLRTDPGAPARFARALDARMGPKGGAATEADTPS